MDSEQIIDHIAALEFVDSRHTADAAAEAVWRVIASAADLQTASEITKNLPGPLMAQ